MRFVALLLTALMLAGCPSGKTTPTQSPNHQGCATAPDGCPLQSGVQPAPSEEK